MNAAATFGRGRDASLGRPRVWSALAWGLIGSHAGCLILLGANIPERRQRGDVAANGVAAFVKERDTIRPRPHKEVVGLNQHGGKGEPVTRSARYLEFVGGSGEEGARGIGTGWRIEDACR